MGIQPQEACKGERGGPRATCARTRDTHVGRALTHRMAVCPSCIPSETGQLRLDICIAGATASANWPAAANPKVSKSPQHRHCLAARPRAAQSCGDLRLVIVRLALDVFEHGRQRYGAGADAAPASAATTAIPLATATTGAAAIGIMPLNSFRALLDRGRLGRDLLASAWPEEARRVRRIFSRCAMAQVTHSWTSPPHRTNNDTKRGQPRMRMARNLGVG